MKDITAILILYSDAAAIQKALASIKRIESRLHAVMVLHEQNVSLTGMLDFTSMKQAQSIIYKENDPGKTLNEVIQNITSPYVLFLHDTDYLSPAIRGKFSLPFPIRVIFNNQLPESKPCDSSAILSVCSFS